MDILGAPIGDILHCAGKRDVAKYLLSQLEEVAVLDPRVAITLFHIFGSYCRMIHLANLASDAFSLFDDDVRQCSTLCLPVQTLGNKPNLALTMVGEFSAPSLLILEQLTLHHYVAQVTVQFIVLISSTLVLLLNSIGTYASRFHIGIQQYHECH